MKKLNLKKGKKYLLACSFGPDSMALFYLLKNQGYKFDVAIVNYHLRKESDSEVNGLMEYTFKYKVNIYVKNITEKITTNVEARCREIRYDFFAKLCDRYHYEAVLIAQHQDDHIETYLLQKDRQNCPNYYGIAEDSVIKGVRVIRPLLGFTKHELEQICIENNVPFAVDKSNYDLSFKRNQIRHGIIANLSEEDRIKLLEEIKSNNNELSSLKSSIDFDRVHSVEYVLSLDENQQKHLFNILAKELYSDAFLSKANVGEVIKVLNSNKPNVVARIKSGLYLIKEYDTFSFSTSKQKDISYSYILKKPDVLDTDYFYLYFKKDSSNRNVSKNDYPLTIRNIYPDDYYVIKGYKAKATRLLIDWKVPLSLRKVWPVIINNKGEIIYIPRYQKDFKPDPDCNFFVKVSK